MKKAKIKIEINDYIIEKEGIIDNDVLVVKDSSDKITFDQKKLLLIKENDELIINIDFKYKTVIYELVKENQKFSNNFEIFSLTNEHKHVMINYQIEGASFLLKINYETI